MRAVASRGPEPLPYRVYVSAGLATALLALALAHGYRLAYLAAGGADFAEVDAVSTTLATAVPVFLAGLAYPLFERRVPRGRAVFSVGILALGVLSALPLVVAPPHPGFAALSAPLHVLVAATAALGVPALVARRRAEPAAEAPLGATP